MQKSDLAGKACSASPTMIDSAVAEWLVAHCMWLSTLLFV